MKRFYLFLVVIALCAFMFGCEEEGIAGIFGLSKPVVVLPDVTLEVESDNSAIMLVAEGGDFSTLDFLFCGVSDIAGAASDCRYISRGTLREFTFTSGTLAALDGVLFSADSDLRLEENKQYNFRVDVEKRNSETDVADNKNAEMSVVTNSLTRPVAEFPAVTFDVDPNNKFISAVIGDDGSFTNLGLYFCGIGDTVQETCSLVSQGDRETVGDSIVFNPSHAGAGVSSIAGYLAEDAVYNFRIDIQNFEDLYGFSDDKSMLVTARTNALGRPVATLPTFTSLLVKLNNSAIEINLVKENADDFDSSSFVISYCGTGDAPSECETLFSPGFKSKVTFASFHAGVDGSSKGLRSHLLLEDTEYHFLVEVTKGNENGFRATDQKSISITTSPFDRPTVVVPTVTLSRESDNSAINISIDRAHQDDFDPATLDVLFCGTGASPSVTCRSFHTDYQPLVRFTSVQAGASASSIGARADLLLEDTEYHFRVEVRKTNDIGFVDEGSTIASTETFSFARPIAVAPLLTLVSRSDNSAIDINIDRATENDFDPATLDILFCGIGNAPSGCNSFSKGFKTKVVFSAEDAGSFASIAVPGYLRENTKYHFSVEVRKTNGLSFEAVDTRAESILIPPFARPVVVFPVNVDFNPVANNTHIVINLQGGSFEDVEIDFCGIGDINTESPTCTNFYDGRATFGNFVVTDAGIHTFLKVDNTYALLSDTKYNFRIKVTTTNKFKFSDFKTQFLSVETKPFPAPVVVLPRVISAVPILDDSSIDSIRFSASTGAAGTYDAFDLSFCGITATAGSCTSVYSGPGVFTGFSFDHDDAGDLRKSAIVPNSLKESTKYHFRFTVTKTNGFRISARKSMDVSTTTPPFPRPVVVLPANVSASVLTSSSAIGSIRISSSGGSAGIYDSYKVFYCGRLAMIGACRLVDDGSNVFTDFSFLPTHAADNSVEVGVLNSLRENTKYHFRFEAEKTNLFGFSNKEHINVDVVTGAFPKPVVMLPYGINAVVESDNSAIRIEFDASEDLGSFTSYVLSFCGIGTVSSACTSLDSQTESLFGGFNFDDKNAGLSVAQGDVKDHLKETTKYHFRFKVIKTNGFGFSVFQDKDFFAWTHVFPRPMVVWPTTHFTLERNNSSLGIRVIGGEFSSYKLFYCGVGTVRGACRSSSIFQTDGAAGSPRQFAFTPASYGSSAGALNASSKYHFRSDIALTNEFGLSDDISNLSRDWEQTTNSVDNSLGVNIGSQTVTHTLSSIDPIEPSAIFTAMRVRQTAVRSDNSTDLVHNLGTVSRHTASARVRCNSDWNRNWQSGYVDTSSVKIEDLIPGTGLNYEIEGIRFFADGNFDWSTRVWYEENGYTCIHKSAPCIYRENISANGQYTNVYRTRISVNEFKDSFVCSRNIPNVSVRIDGEKLWELDSSDGWTTDGVTASSDRITCEYTRPAEFLNFKEHRYANAFDGSITVPNSRRRQFFGHDVTSVNTSLSAIENKNYPFTDSGLNRSAKFDSVYSDEIVDDGSVSDSFLLNRISTSNGKFALRCTSSSKEPTWYNYDSGEINIPRPATATITSGVVGNRLPAFVHSVSKRVIKYKIPVSARFTKPVRASFGDHPTSYNNLGSTVISPDVISYSLYSNFNSDSFTSVDKFELASPLFWPPLSVTSQHGTTANYSVDVINKYTPSP